MHGVMKLFSPLLLIMKTLGYEMKPLYYENIKKIHKVTITPIYQATQ
jgi:hypothetical protein